MKVNKNSIQSKRLKSGRGYEVSYTDGGDTYIRLYFVPFTREKLREVKKLFAEGIESRKIIPRISASYGGKV